MANMIHTGGMYRVICRASKNYPLFRSHGDYEFFLQQLRKETENHLFRIHTWCLLPRCIDLVIEVTGPHTAECLKHLLVKYARHYSRRYGLEGDLFAPMIELTPVENEEELVREGCEVHLHPMKEQIEFENYEYSSYQSYVRDGGAQYRGLTDKSRTLRQFDYDPAEYRDFLREEADHKPYL